MNLAIPFITAATLGLFGAARAARSDTQKQNFGSGEEKSFQPSRSLASSMAAVNLIPS